jgi:MFS superfamily sulfate permease-like transporter
MPRQHGEQEPGVIVVGFPAPLSFLNAYRFRHDLLHLVHHAHEKPRLLVLEATGILSIDFTAAQVLAEVIRRVQAEGIAFAIARLESVRAQDALVRYGIDELLGADHIFRSVEDAIRTLGAGEERKPS